MNDLFIKTMKKLQENRRIERNSKVLKEDKHVDLEGEEKDIVTVIDPDLSTKEFKEKQQEVNDIINNTPEGENVVDTEYVGMKIYTCPLCLSNFYSEVEMDDEAQCPVCFETPDKFVYLGTVEQAASDSDEEAVEKAEQELDNSQPDEETDGEDEYELIDDDTEETDGEDKDKDEYELVDDTEENTYEADEEDNKLFASKQLNLKGKLFREATEEQLPEIHQKPRTGANKNYKKIDIYLDGKYFYSTKAFPTIKSAIEDCKKEYGNEVKGRKLKGMFADRKNESLLTEGGIYPVDLDDNATEKFEEKVGEILGGEVSVNNLELIPAKGFGGSGIYWYKADINVSDENIIKQFLNDKTPIAKRLYDNNELIINMYSDIDVVASDDKYESGVTFDINADTEISDEDYNKLDEEADIVGEQIINKLKENEQTLVNLLKDYEVTEDDEDYVEESKIGRAKLTEQKEDITTDEKIQIILNYCVIEHFEPADLLKELKKYYIQEPEFNELLLNLLLKYSTSEDNERYEEEYNSDDNYDSNYNMIDKPSIREVANQLKDYLGYGDRDTNEEILKTAIDVVDSDVIDSWLNDLKKLNNYDNIVHWGEDDEDYVEESLKSEDTGTIISDKTPAEAETTEVIPEIDIDDLCNSLQNSESINELGNIIIVIPDGEIKDNAKAAFDKCMSEYNFDTNYVANSITEAIHNTTNKLVSEAKITDYMTQQELDKAIKSNSILKNITNSYKVLDDMMIEVTSSVGKSYYKAILNDDGNIELYWISKDGKQLGDSFPLLSEDYKKLDEEVEAEGFKYNNKEYTGLDTYTYTFTLDQEDEFEKAKEELAKTGTVTEIFINNGYGLEYKKDKNI